MLSAADKEHNIEYSVAIIGAGPYGMAVAARLAAFHVKSILLGRPMGFWRENVPIGTRLLSAAESCSLWGDGLEYSAYAAEAGTFPEIFAANHLIDYGLWFQRRACPDSDDRMASHIGRENGRFHVELDDGGQIFAERIVVATGLKPFAFVPAPLAGLHRGPVLHTSDLHDLTLFRGRSVLVIGSGQSALDCAALLSEQGSEVEVVARSTEVRWRRVAGPGPPGPPPKTRRSLRSTVRSFMLSPGNFWWFPPFLRTRELDWVLRPAADPTLQPRVAGVRLTLGRKVTSASVENRAIRLELDDRTTRTVDQVIAGTGYRVDLNALRFLSAQLRSEIQVRAGYPKLNHGMEASVPGLYFVGAPAARNFGPLMWFVHGAPWTAETIARDVAARNRSSVRIPSLRVHKRAR